jgi:hypothetical protein
MALPGTATATDLSQQTIVVQESAPPWNRTKNLVIKSHALCQLS